MYFAQRGYVFVLQDCRGKNESEGVFYPWINEAADGYDTQEWCALQPWSNGNLGTIGESYQAKLQWLAAALQNKHLKTMVSIVPDPDPFLNFPYWNGALFLYAAVWSFVLVNGRRNQLLPPYPDLEKMLRHLPLMELEKVFGRKSAWWRDWLEHARYDEYWKRISCQDKYHRVRVPVLHITGWYDLDGLGSHLNFMGMRREGATRLARENQKLIVGPWPHTVNTSKKIAGINFGGDAIIDLNAKILRWFDHWLKGVDTGITREPPVEIFVMGKNAWRSEREWPLKRAIPTKYFFHSDGAANGDSGGGTLDTIPPGGEPPDRFAYDPGDPVPDLAPPIYSSFIFGAEDQSPVEKREEGFLSIPGRF
jgi:putative CocE/NonD family hydrolase